MLSATLGAAMVGASALSAFFCDNGSGAGEDWPWRRLQRCPGPLDHAPARPGPGPGAGTQPPPCRTLPKPKTISRRERVCRRDRAIGSVCSSPLCLQSACRGLGSRPSRPHAAVVNGRGSPSLLDLQALAPFLSARVQPGATQTCTRAASLSFLCARQPPFLHPQPSRRASSTAATAGSRQAHLLPPPPPAAAAAAPAPRLACGQQSAAAAAMRRLKAIFFGAIKGICDATAVVVFTLSVPRFLCPL